MIHLFQKVHQSLIYNHRTLIQGLSLLQVVYSIVCTSTIKYPCEWAVFKLGFTYFNP